MTVVERRDRVDGAKNLVLTFFPGQGFMIGRDVVRVRVIEVTAEGAVKIGIEAPPTTAVSRDKFTIDQHLEFQRQREEGVRS
jgi:sRNA-binding carbon storage regulator CsrA